MAEESKGLIKLSEVKSPAVLAILQHFPEEVRDKLTLSADKLQLIQSHFEKDSLLGLKRRLPMQCEAGRCPFASICIWQQNDMAPINSPCPEEMAVIDTLVTGLVGDLGVDNENVVELDMINDYVDAGLQEMRAQKMIAIDGTTKDVVVAIDQATSETYSEERENINLTIKERALKRKAQLRKDFLATREMREEYKLKDDKDESKRQASIRKRKEDILARQAAEEEAKFEDIENK